MRLGVQFGQTDGNGFPLAALAGHFDADLITGRAEADFLLQFGHVVHRVAVDGQNDVALANARLLRGRLIGEALDHHPANVLQPSVFRIIRGYRLDGDHQGGPPDAAVIDELGHDVAG